MVLSKQFISYLNFYIKTLVGGSGDSNGGEGMVFEYGGGDQNHDRFVLPRGQNLEKNLI